MAKMIPVPTAIGGTAPNPATKPAQPSPGHDIQADPLLLCLTMAAKLMGKPVHHQVMRAGFALDNMGRVPMAAYPDMAHKNGLLAAWSRMRVADIPHYVLPVLMPLRDGRACVLRSIENSSAVVWWADKGMEDHRISLAELQSLARPEVLALKLPPHATIRHSRPWKALPSVGFGTLCGASEPFMLNRWSPPWSPTC